MADNTLNARIKLKYDLLTNWNNSTFIPLPGEVCIAYIETNAAIAGGGYGNQTNQPRAVGMKVGDGTHRFSALPWIQAAAADVYEWAKAANKPGYTASEITATGLASGDPDSNVQALLGSLYTQMQTLTGGGSGSGEGGGSISSQIIAAIQALDGVITGTPGADKTLISFSETDGIITAEFSNIQISESQVTNLVTDLADKAPKASPTFTGTVTLPVITSASADTAAATKKYVDDTVSNATAGLSGAMHFRGKSTIDLSLAANVSANPTITGYDWSKKQEGDVVLNSTGAKEYVWDGTKWIELGDEVSFIVKGTKFSNSDIASGANIDQSKIANLTTDLAAKQDELGFTSGTAYNKTSNPVATKDYVDSAITSSNTTYAFASGDNDGEIKITPTTGGTQETAINVTPKNLKTVATTGSAYDLNEANGSGSNKFFVIDCGTASILIDTITLS